VVLADVVVATGVPPVAVVYQLVVVAPEGIVAFNVTGLPKHTEVGEADTPVGVGQVCACTEI
jgi:hypothetical protein